MQPTPPEPAGPGGRRRRRGPGRGDGAPWRRELAAALCVIAALAAVGAPVGWLWSTVAPHPWVELIGNHAATVISTEPEAFVAADFALAGLLAGLGLLAGPVAFFGRGRRAALGTVVGLAGGGVLTGVVAAAVGSRIGAGGFDAALRTGPIGHRLYAPVRLHADPVLVVAGFCAVAGFGLLYWRLGDGGDPGEVPDRTAATARWPSADASPG